MINVKLLLFVIIIILVTSSKLHCQTDSTKTLISTYKFVGIEIARPNFTGNIESEFKKVDSNNRSELNSYSPKFNYGVSFSSQNSFVNNPKLSLVPEIGFFLLSGQIEIRQYRGLLVGTNIVYEDVIDINFNNLYLYSALRINHEISRKLALNLYLAPKLSIRVIKTGNIKIGKFEIDYDEPFLQREEVGKEEINGGFDFGGLQTNIEFGFDKTFRIRGNIVKLGIEYEVSVIDFYSQVNFKSNPISLRISYGINQNSSKRKKADNKVQNVHSR